MLARKTRKAIGDAAKVLRKLDLTTSARHSPSRSKRLSGGSDRQHGLRGGAGCRDRPRFGPRGISGQDVLW